MKIADSRTYKDQHNEESWNIGGSRHPHGYKSELFSSHHITEIGIYEVISRLYA
jgi:hypothetical protein